MAVKDNAIPIVALNMSNNSRPTGTHSPRRNEQLEGNREEQGTVAALITGLIAV